MSIYEKNYKGGHPVVGLILGILGMGAALLLCLLTGVIGGAIAAIFGVLAVVLGIQARKSGRGLGGIITGALALVLAVMMTMTAFGLVTTIREEAEKAGTAPLVVKYAEKPQFGLMGFIMSAAQDGVDTDELTKELKSFIEQEPTEQTTEMVGAEPTEAAKP